MTLPRTFGSRPHAETPVAFRSRDADSMARYRWLAEECPHWYAALALEIKKSMFPSPTRRTPKSD